MKIEPLKNFPLYSIHVPGYQYYMNFHICHAQEDSYKGQGSLRGGGGGGGGGGGVGRERGILYFYEHCMHD